MRPFRWIQCAPVLLALGCYTYTPTTIDALAVGGETRVRITAEEASRIAEALTHDARLLEGRILERSDDRLLLQVPVQPRDPAQGAELLYQRIDVPLTGVVEVETRRLNHGRTAVLLGAGAAIVGFAVAHQLGDRGGEPGQPPDGGQPTELVAPAALRRVRIPLITIGFP